jgi:hypothetical protein
MQSGEKHARLREQNMPKPRGEKSHQFEKAKEARETQRLGWANAQDDQRGRRQHQ